MVQILYEVLRYLASVDVKGGSASVGIEAVDRNSPFGLLQGSAKNLKNMNFIFCKLKNLKKYEFHFLQA